jgi:uncharacterized protein YkwD
VIYANDKNRVDVFPFMLVLFSIIVIFYILRPPFLMFFTYQLNWLNHESQSTVMSNSPANPTAGVPVKPVEAPPIPKSLNIDNERWKGPISADPDRDSLNIEIANITGQERAKASRAALITNQALGVVATRHSKDMLERNYMDHISPDGDGPSQRVAMQHRQLFGLIGENVALIHSNPDSPTAMAARFMEGWMNSLGHRRNILSADYTHIGVGCYQQLTPNSPQIKRYCTQLFATLYALSVDPIPESKKKGELLTLKLTPAQGYPLATNAVLSDLASGREMSSVSLAKSNNYATGDLKMTAKAGVYAISIHVPDAATTGRYWIVPGPYITITE